MLVARGNRANERYVRRIRGLAAGARNGIELACGAADGHDVLTPSHRTYGLRSIRFSLARSPCVPSVSFRCHLPSIWYRLYRDALATASTPASAPFDTLDATPKGDERPSSLPQKPRSKRETRDVGRNVPVFCASVKSKNVLYVPSIPARTCGGQSARGGMASLRRWPHER
jgi:hypothetical protein